MLRTLNVLRWVTAGVLAALLLVPAGLVHLASWSIVSVQGGSMSPALHVGDVVLLRPITAAELRPDMIVTARDGAGRYVTHRIDSVAGDGLTLKGDANSTADVETRSADQIVGAVDAVLPSPYGVVLVELQQWPLRTSVLVTMLGLALLPFGRRYASRADLAGPTTVQVMPG